MTERLSVADETWNAGYVGISFNTSVGGVSWIEVGNVNATFTRYLLEPNAIGKEEGTWKNIKGAKAFWESVKRGLSGTRGNAPAALTAEQEEQGVEASAAATIGFTFTAPSGEPGHHEHLVRLTVYVSCRASEAKGFEAKFNTPKALSGLAANTTGWVRMTKSSEVVALSKLAEAVGGGAWAKGTVKIFAVYAEAETESPPGGEMQTLQ